MPTGGTNVCRAGARGDDSADPGLAPLDFSRAPDLSVLKPAPRIGAAWINRLLLGLTLAEERIARPLRLPFGTSLLVIASPSRSPASALDAGLLHFNRWIKCRRPASRKMPGVECKSDPGMAIPGLP